MTTPHQSGMSLKPCPFCGNAEPKLISPVMDSFGMYSGVKQYRYACSTEPYEKCNGHPCTPVFPTVEQAVISWNTRSIAPEGTSMRSAEEWALNWQHKTHEDCVTWEKLAPGTFEGFIKAVQADALASRPSEGTSEDVIEIARGVAKKLSGYMCSGKGDGYHNAAVLGSELCVGIIASALRNMSRPNAEEVQKLQTALARWLPQIVGDGSERDEAAAQDAYLLSGSKIDPENVFAAPNAGIPKEWQPIETAPKDETEIDAWFGYEHDGWIDQIKWIDGEWHRYTVDNSGGYGEMEWLPLIHSKPTHWMSLPHPPATTGKP